MKNHYGGVSEMLVDAAIEREAEHDLTKMFTRNYGALSMAEARVQGNAVLVNVDGNATTLAVVFCEGTDEEKHGVALRIAHLWNAACNKSPHSLYFASTMAHFGREDENAKNCILRAKP